MLQYVIIHVDLFFHQLEVEPHKHCIQDILNVTLKDNRNDNFTNRNFYFLYSNTHTVLLDVYF